MLYQDFSFVQKAPVSSWRVMSLNMLMLNHHEVATMTKLHAILTGVRSDSHTWNLVFMELWLQEQGLRVTNLGSCVPAEEVIAACQQSRPDLLVVSSVNGHGGIEGRELIRALRRARALDRVQTVIGGKLATRPERENALVEVLLAAGFDRVLIGGDALARFRDWIKERKSNHAHGRSGPSARSFRRGLRRASQGSSADCAITFPDRQ